MSPDLHYLSAHQARALFVARELSPVELVAATIARIEAVDPQVNALPIRFFEQALHAAREAEARYAGRGPEPRALEGLPLAIKDETEIEGQPCSDGSLIFKDVIATETAAFAQRIIDAGAIIHARSATPEFCCAAVTESRLWGVTRNPWNLDFSPGGSSGGSGAALAAGTATLATGSDIGGSIRIPASFSGVVGYKPPYGRVPEVPPFNLDTYCHEGPMARSVEDCRLLENVIAGPHRSDIASLRPKLTIPELIGDVHGWRLAFSLNLGDFDVDDEVAATLLAAVESFRELGATVEEVDLPWSREAINEAARAHFSSLFGASIAALLDDHRDEMTSYAIEFAEDSREPTVGLLRGLEIEAEVYAALGALLEHYQVLICPTFAVPALPAGAGFRMEEMFRAGMTIPFNICSRCPVLVVPAGHASSGVPIGLQIVGRTYDDVSVFEAGAALEKTHRWYETESSRPRLLADSGSRR